MTESDKVLVTGFGPFGEHKINASWEAVSALPDSIEGYSIIKHQIPVSYNHIEGNIPLLWEKYNPKLVIHVGVSSCTAVIQIETRANGTGYVRPDVEDAYLEKGRARCIKDDKGECIVTDLCTKTICERLEQKYQIKAELSEDAGRYLCEFIYYVSLRQNSKRALFIHVPPLGKPFSKTELSEALEKIIKCALELINEDERRYTCFPSDTARIYKNGRAAAAF